MLGSGRLPVCVGLPDGYQRRIAPCIDHVAGGIELDHRWRRPRLKRPTQRSCARIRSTDTFRRRQTATLKAARHYKNVVLRVDTGAADLTGYPTVRQWLRPIRIPGHQRRIAHRLCLDRSVPEATDERERQHGRIAIASDYHEILLLRNKIKNP